MQFKDASCKNLLQRWKSSVKSSPASRERSIVEGNRELIRIYEEKVKKVIERVWEG